MKYKTAHFYGKEDIRIEEVSLPKPAEDEVVIKIAYAGICQTDNKKYQDTEDKYTPVLKENGPYVLGHEASGIVEKTGVGVSDFKKGDEVAVLPIISCGECTYCRKGIPEHCLNMLGIGGAAGSFSDCIRLYREKGIGGCFSEYLKLPADNLIRVPDHIPLKIASLLEPVADVVHSVDKTERGKDGSALIIGLGPMGLFHIPVLKNRGVTRIIGSDPLASRRKIAFEIGASDVVDPMDEDLKAFIISRTDGLGVDQVYVTCGGPIQGQNVKEGLRLLKNDGVLNIFASLYKGENPEIDINLVHYNQLSLIGTVGFLLENIFETFEVLGKYEDLFKNLIKPEISLDEINKGFKILNISDALKVVINMTL